MAITAPVTGKFAATAQMLSGRVVRQAAKLATFAPVGAIGRAMGSSFRTDSTAVAEGSMCVRSAQDAFVLASSGPDQGLPRCPSRPNLLTVLGGNLVDLGVEDPQPGQRCGERGGAGGR